MSVRSSTGPRRSSSFLGSIGIGPKLALGFGAVLFLTFAAAAANLVTSENENSISTRIANHLDPARLAALDIVTLVRSIDAGKGLAAVKTHQAL